MNTARSDLLEHHTEIQDQHHHSCLSRRSVMAGGLAGAGALCLAACSGGGDPESETPSATQGEEPTSAAPSDEPTTEPTEGSGEGEEPAGDVVAQLADVPVGGAISLEIAGQPALLTQPEAGTVAAFSAICTHQGCTVAPGEGELACPCHGSSFAIADGAVLTGPAQEPLVSIPVSVSGDAVVAT